MKKQLAMLIVLCSLAATTTKLCAAEAAVAVDRSQLTLGESFQVKIHVRKSAGKPLVQPPKVAGCRIELLGTSQASTGVRGMSPAPRRSPGNSITNIGPLVDAIGKLESDTQKALADQGMANGAQSGGARHAAGDSTTGARCAAGSEQHRVRDHLPHHSRMVGRVDLAVVHHRERRADAADQAAGDHGGGETGCCRDAARGGAGAGQATSAIHGGEDKSRDVAAGVWRPRASGRAHASWRYWSWLAGVLAIPFVIVTALWSWRRWQRRRTATAPERQQRQAASTARRELEQSLRPGAEPEALGAALTNYARGRWTLPPGEVTPAEVARSLAASDVSAEIAERFALILDACSAARFAPGGVAVLEKDLVTEARELIQLLDRQGR